VRAFGGFQTFVSRVRHKCLETFRGIKPSEAKWSAHEPV
jgi:hypothetical protein